MIYKYLCDDIDVYKYVAYCNTNGLEYTFSANSVVGLQDEIEYWYQEGELKPMMSKIIDDKIVIDDFHFFVYSKLEDINLEDINDKFKEEEA
jgi:hypothetical protein